MILVTLNLKTAKQSKICPTFNVFFSNNAVTKVDIDISKLDY